MYDIMVYKFERKDIKVNKYYFTSESVTEGHPDKLCDYIADSILDECLKQDKFSRTAIEVFAYNNTIEVVGQVTSNAQIEIEKIVREKVKEIGYDDEYTGMNYKNCEININITKQSPDIALGVDIGGAGDQGIMFGYACNETDNYMPYAINLAHKLANRLTIVRKEKIIPYIRPDGKTQVTVEYVEGKPKRIETVLISTQHLEEINIEKLREDVKKEVIDAVIDSNMIDENTKIYINPTGRFVIGGPLGDTGLTGRKIIVDTYGGYARHGGGAFSGKDCTKVDRSAAYAARYVAKNIVAAGLADKCEVQLSYAIGVAHPTSIMIDSYGTGKLSDNKLTDIVRENFDLRPAGIIKMLDLRRPIYKQTSAYGHFGRNDLDLPWEELDKVEDLKKYL